MKLAILLILFSNSRANVDNHSGIPDQRFNEIPLVAKHHPRNLLFRRAVQAHGADRGTSKRQKRR